MNDDVRFVNLTPHCLNFFSPDGERVCDVEPSGAVARVESVDVPLPSVGGLPVVGSRPGAVTGLPAPKDGVVYLVSGFVASHPEVMDREDVFAPGRLLRDENGKPMGAVGLRKPLAP